MALTSVFGSNGLLDLNRLKKERDTIIKKNDLIRKQNLALLREIDRLNHDMDYIESVARRELGLIGKDDVILKFK
jgi:cell division protein FtsB